MTRLTRTTTAASAAVVLLALVPLGSLGDSQPGDEELTPHRTTALRGTPATTAMAVLPATLEDDLRGARTSHPMPTGLVPGRSVRAGSELRLQFWRHLADSDVEAVPAAGPAPRQDGAAVVVPLPGTGGRDLGVEVRGRVSDADGRTRRSREPVTVVAPTAHDVSPEGFRVAAGTGPVVGFDGPLVRWTAEVEPATGRPLDHVLPVMAAALGNPDHGWTARGERRLQRVGDVAVADVRVVLATPDTVDAFCAQHGLNTVGIFSCWDGQRAMLNLTRWDHGATDFDDLAAYRTYQVNHEVGHGLGRGHVDCPAAGVPAPIMMQQTKSAGECRPNGWPYP